MARARERNAEMTATYTVNCSILLTDLPLLDRAGAARNAGFDAVEFWWPFDSPTPPDADVTVFIRAIQDAGVQLTGLNFAAGDMLALSPVRSTSSVRWGRDHAPISCAALSPKRINLGPNA